MKGIISIVFLAIIMAGCISNNKTSGKLNSQADSSTKVSPNSSEGLKDTSRLSVVWPIIPDRQITVGGADADIKGFSSEAIQTAIDAIHENGGSGTIVLSAGTYDIIAPVRLYDNMALVGSGTATILKKCKGISSPFAIDADYGELQVTVPDAKGFKPGMGAAVYDDDQRSGWALTTAKITAIKENTIYLNDYLLRDYRTDRKGTISNACPVIEAVSAENIRIANLTVDGSKESNEMIDGCRAGGVYLHKVHKAIVENVTVRNFNSDGISWQITEFVTVRNCEVYGCTNSGLHPGTGSPYTVIEGNNSHDNGGYGLFVCWRVRNGFVRNNSFHDNGINGISTGHKDTGLLFSGNHIFNNGADGVSLRGEAPNNEPDNTVLINNIIENNGTKGSGYGISIYCPAKGVIIQNNTIRNTGNGKQLAALFQASGSLPPTMVKNIVRGHPNGEIVLEKK